MLCSRRGFLKASLGASTVLSFGSTTPLFLARSALARAARPAADGTVLVVVQLTGGNDGLNTVIPFEDDDYGRSRPTLRMPADRVHRIDTLLGFHPDMEAFRRLYEEGLLTVVQGVGYPGSSRDHESALRDWHTARPGDVACQTGWAGRAIDDLQGREDGSVPGVFVGTIDPPFGIHTETTIVPSIPSLDEGLFRAPRGFVEGGGRSDTARAFGASSDDSLLEFVQRTTLDAYASGRRLEAVTESARSAGPDYPPFQLARTLQTVAQLLRAEIGIRIYFTELGGGGFGGFDSHANQAGNHGALLRELAESVAAFVTDLKRDGLLDRVVLMTFSEFGRTVAENGRRGTGHGVAAPMFLAGGKVRGGLVGPHPSLSDLDNGALRVHTDLRRVYATVLEGWLGLDSRDIIGAQFEPLDVLRS